MLWCCVGSVGSEGRASSRLCLFLWHTWKGGSGLRWQLGDPAAWLGWAACARLGFAMEMGSRLRSLRAGSSNPPRALGVVRLPARGRAASPRPGEEVRGAVRPPGLRGTP